MRLNVIDARIPNFCTAWDTSVTENYDAFYL